MIVYAQATRWLRDGSNMIVYAQATAACVSHGNHDTYYLQSLYGALQSLHCYRVRLSCVLRPTIHPTFSTGGFASLDLVAHEGFPSLVVDHVDGAVLRNLWNRRE